MEDILVVVGWLFFGLEIIKNSVLDLKFR